jgi:hypothetical protein
MFYCDNISEDNISEDNCLKKAPVTVLSTHPEFRSVCEEISASEWWADQFDEDGNYR